MATELSNEDAAAFAAMQDADQAARNAVEQNEAPEVPAEEQDEGAEGEQPEAKQGKEAAPPKMVRLEALHEERGKRRNLESENQRLREERARFDERLRVIQEMNARQADPEPMPDVENDPLGVIRAQGKQLEEMQAAARQTEEQRRQNAVRDHLLGAYRADASQFRAKNPEFDDAYRFLVNGRTEELIALGFSPQEASEALQNDELAIAHRALSNGKSPSEALMAMAKVRGFKPKAVAADASQKIERVSEGQSRGRSLSQAGGDAAPAEMTAERLIKMSAAEFEAWTAKHPAQTKRLMGG